MTLDELLGEATEAAKTGALVELDALTALTLVEDCIDYNAAIIRLETMLGHGADGGPSMDAMLDEVRAIVADFAALKAAVVEYCEAEKSQSLKLSAKASVEAWYPAYARSRSAREALFGLIDRLEPKRPSPVLEIAGINHE